MIVMLKTFSKQEGTEVLFRSFMSRLNCGPKLIAAIFILLLGIICSNPLEGTKVVEATFHLAGDDGAEAWIFDYPAATRNNNNATTLNTIPPSVFHNKTILCIKNWNHEPQSVDCEYILILKLDNGQTICVDSGEHQPDTKLMHFPDAPAADPQGWRKIDFDDSGWGGVVFQTPSQRGGDIFKNPCTDSPVDAISSHEHGNNPNLANEMDYYRVLITLPIEEPTPVPADTATSTPSGTATPKPANTSTQTATPLKTATPLPTSTPMPTATMPPVFTPVPTSTALPMATFTPVFTATPMPTATPVPLMLTFTPVPFTPTNTPIPAVRKAPPPIPPATLAPTPREVPTRPFVLLIARGTPAITFTATPVQLVLVKTLALDYKDKNEQNYMYKINWFCPIELETGFKIVDQLPDFLEINGYTQGGKYHADTHRIEFKVPGPIVRGSTGELFFIMKRGLDQIIAPDKGTARSRATGIYVFNDILYSVSSNEVITKVEPQDQNKK